MDPAVAFLVAVAAAARYTVPVTLAVKIPLVVFPEVVLESAKVTVPFAAVNFTFAVVAVEEYFKVTALELA
jgi:hypothetical protein